MSVAEETIRAEKISRAKSAPILNRVLDFLSSVRFGVALLCVLVVFSMVGMLVIQQNVQGFETAYAVMTPAEKTIYGWLGIFDIYHSWYYNFLLLVLSLNIVLASIDRFPSAWKYIVAPKISATRDWLLAQKQHKILPFVGDEETAAQKVKRIFTANGFKSRISEGGYAAYARDENGGKIFGQIENKSYLFVFGERGKWNRLGAYVVHVFLLTLFLGHFVALQTGFDADVSLTPDTNQSQQEIKRAQAAHTTDQIQMIRFNLDKQERFNVKLPFTISCEEIDQKLIDPNGSIAINNTMDWRTRIRIDDPEYGTTVADVSLNRPFSYRGYRFFQASAIPFGKASSMTLDVIPANGGAAQTVELKRNGTANLPDGTQIKYDSFFPDFVMQGGEFATKSGEYNNPVVVLEVTPPNGATERVFAFGNKLPDNAPINAPKAGYRWRLKSFEKSPMAHVLSIKYDPFSAAFIAWYIGGFGLIGALAFVFFMSHRRVWALIDADKNEIVLGGDANRNHFGFEDKFKRIVSGLENEDADDT